MRHVLVWCALLPLAVADPGQTHLVYTVEVKADGPRHFHFTVDVTNPDRDELVFVVPHWAPGAYRELTVGARSRTVAWDQLAGIKAVDGEGVARAVRPDGDRRWRVESKGAKRITFSYSNTQPGRPNNNRSYLGARSGLIDGPRNWMYVEGLKDLPVHVHFKLPDGWEVGTGLDPTFDPKVYTAKDYDRLVDCPTLVGSMKSWMFYYRGVPHRVVADTGNGDVSVREGEFLDMVRKVVKVYVDMFDDVPYEHYTFIYTPGGGGLEHLTSTTIGFGRRGLSASALMSVTAHEFFHTWNVKRLRPARLGPFDYTGPQPVNDLWICEGLTSYYTPLGLWRAGLYSDGAFLARQGGAIGSWERNAASQTQSPEESSRGIWTNNSRISYYLQGQVLGMMIDLEIRGATDNRHSLDDVMRHMYARYGGYYRHQPPKPGFRSEDWPREIKELTGVNVDWFWDAHIRESKPVDWNRFLAHAGWELKMSTRRMSSLAAARTRRGDGGQVELEVARGGALFRAGFRDGDVIRKINGEAPRGRFSARRAFRGLDAGSRFVVDLERGGEAIQVKGEAEASTEFGSLPLSATDGGVRVGEIPRGTGMYEDGLRDEDVITACDGRPAERLATLRAYLSGRRMGETVSFSIQRGPATTTCKVKVKAREVRRVGSLEAMEKLTPAQRRVRMGMKTGGTR